MTNPSQRPTLRQALLITLGGFLFAFFSCIGALAGMGSNFSDTPASEAGFAGFVLGLLVFLVGLVMLLWVLVRWLSNRRNVNS
ncbi:MAG: hypothetical protein U0Q11_03905 [Vicinamibacterales bacterium]